MKLETTLLTAQSAREVFNKSLNQRKIEDAIKHLNQAILQACNRGECHLVYNYWWPSDLTAAEMQHFKNILREAGYTVGQESTLNW